MFAVLKERCCTRLNYSRFKFTQIYKKNRGILLTSKNWFSGKWSCVNPRLSVDSLGVWCKTKQCIQSFNSNEWLSFVASCFEASVKEKFSFFLFWFDQKQTVASVIMCNCLFLVLTSCFLFCLIEVLWDISKELFRLFYFELSELWLEKWKRECVSLCKISMAKGERFFQFFFWAFCELQWISGKTEIEHPADV